MKTPAFTIAKSKKNESPCKKGIEIETWEVEGPFDVVISNLNKLAEE